MALTLGLFDHVLFLVLAVLFPLRAGLLAFRRLKRASEEDLPRVRRAMYRNAMLMQWAFTLALLLAWLALRRPWVTLGLAPRWTWGLEGVLAGLAIVVVVMLRQNRIRPADDEALERVRQRTKHLERMLPATPGELRWFYALSVTAGICEETLYRGFLIWYLAAWLAPAVPGRFLFLAAAAAASVVFGVAHAYQGWRGVLATGAVGGFLAAVYWISRSLYPGMLIHALMDAHAGYLGHLALSRARERETAAAEEAARLAAEAAEPGDSAPAGDAPAPEVGGPGAGAPPPRPWGA